MTNEKKLEVIEEAFNYYHDRTALNNKEEKELLLLVNEIYEAINYTRCCEKLPTKESIYDEIKRLTDLYYNDDNARKSAFGLGVSTGVNLVNKEILK